MSLKSSNDWNHYLLRFLLAFAFWEVLAFPLRLLFFSKFYHDPSLSRIFISISDVYWLGPILADFIGIFALGAAYFIGRGGFPVGLVGGLLFGFTFSIAAYFAPTLLLTSVTSIVPNNLWWVWVSFLSLQAITVSIVYSISFDDNDD